MGHIGAENQRNARASERQAEAGEDGVELMDQIELRIATELPEELAHVMHIAETPKESAGAESGGGVDGDVGGQRFAKVDLLGNDVEPVACAGKTREKPVSDQTITVGDVVGEEIGAVRNKNCKRSIHDCSSAGVRNFCEVICASMREAARVM